LCLKLVVFEFCLLQRHNFYWFRDEFSAHTITRRINGTNKNGTQKRDDEGNCKHNCRPVLVHPIHLLFERLFHPILVYAEFSLRSCFRCNTQMSKITNFKQNYLQNYNDSEHAVKTKNAPFCMNFPNIYFLAIFEICVLQRKHERSENSSLNQ